MRSVTLMQDITQQLQEQIASALAQKTALNIIGGDSKSWYGRTPWGQPLHVGAHQGITHYEPTELVISVRTGTSLEEIEHTLNEQHQMLPFEPSYFGPSATIGGTVAGNLSGPRRPYSGALRDHMLGTRLINGKAEVMRFGGEVMKNVAGYDVSRLMCGAMGTLGVLLEVSLKVLPRPEREMTLVQEISAEQAIHSMNRWAGQSLPISATAWHDGRLYIRLSAAEQAVTAASRSITGAVLQEGDIFWREIREHQLPFFNTQMPLWRLSLPPTCGSLPVKGETLIEWGGALRWLISDTPAADIFRAAADAGGHATLFANGDRTGQVFQPLPHGLFALHQRLRQAFDPQGIFNPGRMYEEL